MADYEHLWISDSEISYGKKSGGSRLTIPRDDRRDHSRILDRSFSEAWEAMESHPSSFDNPDTVVLVMKFNGVRRKKNITDRRDAELSSLGMEVKAVIDGEYILIGMRKDDMTSLRSKLRSYGDETASVDILDEIEGFSPNTGLRKCSDDVISDSETGSIDTILLLVPNMTDADYETAFPNIERRVRELGGTVRHESISSVGMPYMSVTIPSEGAVQSICDDQAIYRVYKDEKASLDDFFLSEPWLNDLKPDFDRDTSSLPIVCLIDGGIPSDSYLEPMVVHDNPGIPSNGDHATQVGSRIVFGYIPQSGEAQTLVPECRIVECNIFQRDMTESNLVKAIEAAVSKYAGICKVFNLCINFSRMFEGVTVLSECLDRLQESNDIAFVISSGNYKGPILAKSIDDVIADPMFMIYNPAQSVNSITVGAAAYSRIGQSLADRNQMIPYSRHGPGIGGTVKPDMLAYATNMDYYEHGSYRSQDPMSFTMSDNGVVHAVGTSFAAPIVSNILARIVDRFENLSMISCKAILLHNCIPTAHKRKTPVNAVGFGIADPNGCFDSEPGCVTFIREGVIGDEHKIIMFDIYIPESLRGRPCTVRLTCMSRPVLDPSGGPTYIRSSISITLRRRDEAGSFEKDEYKADWKRGSVKDPCQMKSYKFERMDTDELQIRLTSTIDPSSKTRSVPYAVILTLEDESRTLDIYREIVRTGRYKAISEIKIRDRNKERITNSVPTRRSS